MSAHGLLLPDKLRLEHGPFQQPLSAEGKERRGDLHLQSLFTNGFGLQTMTFTQGSASPLQDMMHPGKCRGLSLPCRCRDKGGSSKASRSFARPCSVSWSWKAAARMLPRRRSRSPFAPARTPRAHPTRAPHACAALVRVCSRGVDGATRCEGVWHGRGDGRRYSGRREGEWGGGAREQSKARAGQNRRNARAEADR